MIIQAVTALVQAASVSWVMYCVFNYLRGIGQISNYMAALVLGSEILSPSARVNYTVVGHCLGYGMGYALLPLLAYFIRGWRMLLVASAIPSILSIPMWWVIPESPRWLLQKGRVEEAELVIRNAAKKNNVPAPEVIFRAEDCLWLMQNKGDEEHMYTYMDLIRTPNIRNITILGVFIWMSVALVFFGLSLNTSNVNGNVYLNCFISAATDIAAYLLTRLLIFTVPRPTFLSSAMMVCGIMFLLIQLVPNDMPALFQVFAVVGRMGVSSSYCFLFVMFTELSPTVVRNMSLGVYSMAACTGTIISPFLIYMGNYNKFLPYIIFGTVSIMAAGISLLLPDTRHSKLPDLISQARPLRGCCCPKVTATAYSDATEGCEDMDKNSPC